MSLRAHSHGILLSHEPYVLDKNLSQRKKVLDKFPLHEFLAIDQTQ